MHSILQRVRDLTVQASNTGVVTTTAAGYIGKEIDELAGALEDIAKRTDFNGTKLLLGASGDPATAAAGDAALSLTFQTGANGDETIDVDLTNVLAMAQAVKQVATCVTNGGTAYVDSVNDLALIDAQIEKVSGARATLGASQNRLESTINSLNVAVENLSASESRVRDADMAQ
ncbi:flagellin, partial [Blastococcus sp. SYSU DS0616]